MDLHKIRDEDFALLIGKDRTIVSKIRRGVVRPTLEVAGVIEERTGGEVPMQAWLDAKADASEAA